MTEPWVNFSDLEQDLDLAIFLRPDGLERVHIYKRPSGSFGVRNYIRSNALSAESWEVGKTWGHHYDSVATAVKEALEQFDWMQEFAGVI
jgi:hypothetical protein